MKFWRIFFALIFFPLIGNAQQVDIIKTASAPGGCYCHADDNVRVRYTMSLGDGFDPTKNYFHLYATVMRRGHAGAGGAFTYGNPIDDGPRFQVRKGVLTNGGGAATNQIFSTKSEPGRLSNDEGIDVWDFVGDGNVYYDHPSDGLPPRIVGKATPVYASIHVHPVVSASYTGVTKELNIHLSVSYQPEDDCEDGCEGEDCAPGEITANMSSIAVTAGLGKALNGKSSGALHIRRPYPTPTLGRPSGLQVVAGKGFEVLTNAAGIRQVLGPDVLANVVTNTSASYDLEFFKRQNVLAKDGSGFYETTNSPFKTVTFAYEESSPAGTNTFSILENDGGTLTTNLYTYVTNTSTLSLELVGSAKRESITRTQIDSLEREELRSLVTSGNPDVVNHEELKRYRTFPWGEELVLTVLDPNGAKLTNSWDYYTNSSSIGNLGLLKERITPTGAWERYEYSGHYRITKIISSHLNAPLGASESDSNVKSFSYVTNGSSFVESKVETLLGQEIGRSYRVFTLDTVQEIQCQTPGAATNATDNLVSITTKYSDGTDFTAGKLKSLKHSDGTMSFYSYTTNSSGQFLTISTNGVPNVSGTAVLEGSKSVQLVGPAGEPLSNAVVTIQNGNEGIVTAREVYTYTTNEIDFRRTERVDYLNGEWSGKQYECCGLYSSTNRQGEITYYEHDDLGRPVATIDHFLVKTTNVLDAAGNVLKEIRIGTDATEVVLRQTAYDLAGRTIKETNSFGGVTTVSYGFDAFGNSVTTNSYPDGGTRVETKAKDGFVLSVSGTAAQPFARTNGVELENGVYRYFEVTTLLDENGGTNEWSKTYFDTLKRPYKTIYSNSSTNESIYNDLGQLIQTVDRDGLTNIISYNALGEIEYEAVDLDGGGLTLGGRDRVTRTTNDVVFDATLNRDVRRTRRQLWKNIDDPTTTIEFTSLASIDGFRTWNDSFGLISETRRGLAVNGSRSITNIAPDASYTISSNYYGRLMSMAHYDASGDQLERKTFGYDAHGRRNTEMDARNGTTSYTFTNDVILTVTTPVPGPMEAAQTVTLGYNNLGQVTSTTLPDDAAVFQDYYLTGHPRTKWGARTYPASYAYDAQSRLRFMTNWSDFGTSTGARVTEWQYESISGFLRAKLYPDTTSILYTNTPGGRLKSRTSARGVSAIYDYTAAGELFSVNYNDGTPGITNDYNRLRQLVAVTNGENITLKVPNEAGLILTESYLGGPLDGIVVTNSYDAFLRRTNLAMHGTAVAYGYGAASRLETVGASGCSVDYLYAPNSPLVMSVQLVGGTSLTITNDYDFLNRLSRIAANDPNTTVAGFDYHYNAANQRTNITHADGSYWLHQYDSLGQVESSKRYWSDGTLVAGQQFEFDFDTIGNRTETSVGGDEFGSNLRTAIYEANGVNQLTEREVPGYAEIIGMADDRSLVQVNGEAAYRRGEYFRKELAIDNSAAAVYQGITNESIFGGFTTTVTGNVYVAKTPELFLYDADGNLTNDGRWTFRWDAENRLSNIVSYSSAPVSSRRSLNLTYDYRGRRIQKAVSTNNGSIYVTQYTRRFIYDGWNLIAELDESNNLLHSYVWGTDLSGSMQGAGGVGGLLSMTVHSGAEAGTYFYSYDGNGNVATLVNAATGEIAARYEYGPFGELNRATGPMAFENPFRFSTKYTDDETDLLYYGYRYYNPSTGRWLSRDPIEEQGGLNLYGFVRNHPIGRVDWLGLFEVEKDTRVIYVKKCEIGIVYGHQNPKQPWRFKFEAGGCSAGGAIMCFPGRSNADDVLPPENQIPGLPKHDDWVWAYPNNLPTNDGSQMETRRAERRPDEDLNLLLRKAGRNARIKAAEICKKNCCPQVTIHYYRNAKNYGNDKKVVPNKSNVVVDCGTIDKERNYEQYIEPPDRPGCNQCP